MAKTIEERVTVMHRWNEDREMNEYLVLYDRPRSKKLSIVKVIDAPLNNDGSTGTDPAIAAYGWRSGFVAGLQEAEK